MMRFGIDFGGLLDRFWDDLGPKLGGKMGPSWHQILKNGGPKTMSKKVMQKVDASHGGSCRAMQAGGVGVPNRAEP